MTLESLESTEFMVFSGDFLSSDKVFVKVHKIAEFIAKLGKNWGGIWGLCFPQLQLESLPVKHLEDMLSYFFKVNNAKTA